MGKAKCENCESEFIVKKVNLSSGYIEGLLCEKCAAQKRQQKEVDIKSMNANKEMRLKLEQKKGEAELEASKFKAKIEQTKAVNEEEERFLKRKNDLVLAQMRAETREKQKQEETITKQKKERSDIDMEHRAESNKLDIEKEKSQSEIRINEEKAKHELQKEMEKLKMDNEPLRIKVANSDKSIEVTLPARFNAQADRLFSLLSSQPAPPSAPVLKDKVPEATVKESSNKGNCDFFLPPSENKKPE